MKRNKTDLRHVNTKTGKVTRVTECDGKYYIGDTNIRAEGNMTHYRGVKHINYGKCSLFIDFLISVNPSCLA